MLPNLARFDLVSVRLVVWCEQHGSLSAAARASHLAVAAASRRLQDLEAAVGTPLFERHARGLKPTAAGRLFVKHGLALLQTLDQLDTELGDLRQGVARHIRLCASTAAINQFLPPLLARWSQAHPEVRVDLEEQVSEAVTHALHEGRADLGILVAGPDTTGLHTQLFRRDELVLILPPDHPQARSRRPVPFADLLDEDWISLNHGAAMLRNQQQAALAAQRPLRLRMQVRSFDAVCHLVASGLGLAILPKAAAQPMARSMGLRTRALADAWAQRELLIAQPAATQDPVVHALVAFLVQT